MVNNNHLKLTGTVKLCTKVPKQILQTSININADVETYFVWQKEAIHFKTIMNI